MLPALAPLAASTAAPLCFDIHREDQERTAALLRRGAVVAAVTAEADPVPGCSSTRLGGMRYRPMAATGYLQHRYLRTRLPGHGNGEVGEHAPPTHHVPSSADFLTAVRLGLGWGMIPDLQSAPHEADGGLVDVDPAGAVDVVLHWQQWKLRSPTLDRLSAAVLDAARRVR